MDLWDLTKLLLRRWYLAVPMLIASITMMVLAAQGVSPDYKSTGHLQMIPPPSLGKPVNPAAPVRAQNPWLALGYPALGNAALLKVTDPPMLKTLEAEGLSASVTVTLADRLPLLVIEAIGTSREQATATVRRVIKLLAEDIAAEQRQYGVASEDTITALTLNDGDSVEVITSKVKRALVVAGGVGMLVTVAGTTGLDALMRRRSRRRLGLEPMAPEGTSMGGGDAAPRSPAPAFPPPVPVARSQDQKTSVVGARAPGAVAEPADRAKAIHPSRGPLDAAALTMEFKPASEGRLPVAKPEAAPDDGTETTVIPADATIVLPLPHGAGWPWREGKNNGK